MEAIEEAQYETHLSEHRDYPQAWCGWCEEEREDAQAQIENEREGKGKENDPERS
jgi:hypothetical protein